MRVALFALILTACGKDENSPDMGAVPPKPNPSVQTNVPGGAAGTSVPGADAQAMGKR